MTNLIDPRISAETTSVPDQVTDNRNASGHTQDVPSRLAPTKRVPYKAEPASEATMSSFDTTVTTLLRQLVKQASVAIDESDTDGEASSATENESASESGRAEHRMEAHCLRPLTTYINLLMDLCPTLEHTYKDVHTSYLRRPQKRLQHDISVTPAAMPYVSNVQDKFPRANQELLRRLGEANWQRHERLRAIKTHGPSSEAIIFKESKSLFQQVSLFQDSALGSSIRTQSHRSESNASHSSFASSSADQEKGRFRVPGLPKGVSYGETFSCPYCSNEVSRVKNRIDWK